MEASTVYRTTQIDGLSIFYREAGPTDAPTLLLLHGLPSSSRMFEPLFARIADRYHLVAPDYPGFGRNDWPDPKAFAYTFDHYAVIVTRFTEALGLKHYTLYMQDYGGPVGFRMALAHPERIEGMIWGKYDFSFEPSEPEAYRRDVPNADVQVLDAGHFALDTAADEIAELVGSFLRSALPSSRKGEVHA